MCFSGQEWDGRRKTETLSIRILKDEQGFGESGCGEYHSMGKQEKALQFICLSDFMKAEQLLRYMMQITRTVDKKWNSQAFLKAPQEEAKDIGYL